MWTAARKQRPSKATYPFSALPRTVMRVLFDVKHPADVLLFKDAIGALRQEGHAVQVASRAKDETLALLDGLGIEHVCLSRMGRGVARMGLELVDRTARTFRLERTFRPDVMVGRTAVCMPLVGRARRIPTIVFEDTEFAWFQIRPWVSLATVVCTGLGYGRRFPGKELRFNAPPQLAYTHPSRFRPDAAALRAHGIEPDRPLIVMRLKSWVALHDIGLKGFGERQIVSLVEELARHGRPIVSAESAVPPRLAQYANPLPPEHVLHLLAYAQLYVGEGASMAAEAACLGTPAIFLSPASRRGYLDAMERKYGLVTTVPTISEALERAREWLAAPDLKERAEEARRQLVADSEDPVPFMLNVIRRYGGG